jgi:hypothetical protein
MKKLKLAVESLAVESFPTAEAIEQMGTVEGAELVPTPPYLTCPAGTRLTICPCTPKY